MDTAAAPDAKSAALGPLHQHKTDEPKADHKMDGEENGLHADQGSRRKQTDARPSHGRGASRAQ